MRRVAFDLQRLGEVDEVKFVQGDHGPGGAIEGLAAFAEQFLDVRLLARVGLLLDLFTQQLDLFGQQQRPRLVRVDLPGDAHPFAAFDHLDHLGEGTATFAQHGDTLFHAGMQGQSGVEGPLQTTLHFRDVDQTYLVLGEHLRKSLVERLGPLFEQLLQLRLRLGRRLQLQFLAAKFDLLGEIDAAGKVDVELLGGADLLALFDHFNGLLESLTNRLPQGDAFLRRREQRQPGMANVARHGADFRRRRQPHFVLSHQARERLVEEFGSLLLQFLDLGGAVLLLGPANSERPPGRQDQRDDCKSIPWGHASLRSSVLRFTIRVLNVLGGRVLGTPSTRLRHLAGKREFNSVFV